ncbi:MAG: hypothetical protein AAGH64_12220 [Planctomycetota bacterium]
MTSTIKSVLSVACVSLATLALAGCGGGGEGGDANGSSSNGSGSGSSAGGSGGVAQEGPAFRVVDDFVTHMANGEYGEARELTDSGGSGSILDDYIQMMDGINQNPNGAALMSAVFDPVTARFADAGIELVEQGDDSATVRLTLGDETHDVGVTSLDGESWTISLPQGVLSPVQGLMNSTPAAPQLP